MTSGNTHVGDDGATKMSYAGSTCPMPAATANIKRPNKCLSSRTIDGERMHTGDGGYAFILRHNPPLLVAGAPDSRIYYYFCFKF
jgi:hypothetical protein